MIIRSIDGQTVINFPDDTNFERDIPWRGWFRVISNGKTWWFNGDSVMYVGPGTETPHADAS